MNVFDLINSINKFIDFLNSPLSSYGTNMLGPLQPMVIKYMGSTSLELTTTNQVIITAWGTSLAMANAFFLLLIIMGTIQTMIANSTGSLSIPVSQFVPKIIVTGLMMNLSFFFGQDLLILNNLLCGEVNANLNAFFNTMNNGGRVTVGQGLILSLVIFILLNISIIKLLFQAFGRLVLWNLLFVLSPLAFLLAFLPQTSAAFSVWGRMFLVVTFTQFIQFLALALGIALLASAGQNGFTGYLMAIAMLFLVGKIPDMLARFPSMGISNSQGLGQILSTAIVAARLMAV